MFALESSQPFGLVRPEQFRRSPLGKIEHVYRVTALRRLGFATALQPLERVGAHGFQHAKTGLVADVAAHQAVLNQRRHIVAPSYARGGSRREAADECA
jgi:hypothetical protein